MGVRGGPKRQVKKGGGGDGVVKPTVVILADGATVESPHADVGGTATTTVAFKMNVWADGDTMTLTPTSATTGVTFSAVVVPAKGITSANSTCTVTAGSAALADVPISIAFSGSASNQPAADIVVTGSNTLAMTAGANNAPFKTDAANGWTQYMHLPEDSGNFFYGDNMRLVNNNVLQFHPVAYPTGNTSGTYSSTSRWQKAWPSSWTQICFQTINPSGGTPAYWAIFNKATLTSYIAGRTNYVNDTTTAFQRNGSPSFSDGGILGASHDYVYFHFNNQLRNPYVRVGSANYPDGNQLIYMEGNSGSSGGGTWTQLDEWPLGVFLR